MRTFRSVDKTSFCEYSKESCWVVLSCVAARYSAQDGSNFHDVDKALLCDYSTESFGVMGSRGTVKGGSNFWIRMTPQCVTIKLKLLRNTFTWFLLLYWTRWFQLFSLWTKPRCVTVQVKAIEKCFLMVLFIMLNKVALTFKSGFNSYESYWKQFFLVVLFTQYLVQSGVNFELRIK